MRAKKEPTLAWWFAGSSLRGLWAVLAVAAALCLATAQALTIDATDAPDLTVDVKAADGTKVGEIHIHLAPDRSGVMGGFVSSYGEPPSLDAAAAKCGEHHFNWFQRVVSDNYPPNGPDGKPLTAPYWDPPLGGYGWPDTQWADNRAWYWDEGPNPPPGTPGFDSRYKAENRTFDPNGDGVKEVLDYQDFPLGPIGTEVVFQTWLVSLNADGSLHSFHGGFAWQWTHPDEEPDGDAFRRWLDPTGVGTVYLSQTPLTPEQGWNAYGQSIPEPATAALLALGVAVMAARRRRLAA